MLFYVFLLLALTLHSVAGGQGDGHGHDKQRLHKPLQFDPKEARQRDHLMGHLDDFVKRPGRKTVGKDGQQGGQGAAHGHDHAQPAVAPEHPAPQGAGDEQAFTDEELEFHYFRSNDYDNNNMLDGLEILKALLEEATHKHEGEEGGSNVMTDQQLAELVDAVMAEQDTNRDGYIDYSEFAAAQRKERSQTSRNAL